jgi:PmbA protein
MVAPFAARMIDAALPTMIDEALPRPGKMSASAVAGSARRRHLEDSMLAPTASLFDQTPLLERAERLVKAARAAGADAADAVAVRALSLSIAVREGAVEESESAEGDDLGLRVLVGKRQAVVSSNDLTGDARMLAERAVAMARAAPEDKYAGLADDALLAHDFPDLDLIDRALPDVHALETMARAAEEAALAVPGVSKSDGASASAGIGGMVLVTSHGFRGSYLGSSHGLSMVAIAGQGTAMERDYDYSSVRHAADLDSAETIGRNAGTRAVARINPRKVSTRKVPVVFDRRIAGSLVSHLAGAANGASVARKTSFLRDKMGQKLFAAGISIIDDPLRKRGLRSHPFDGEGVAGKKLALIEDGVLRSWLLDCATARELDLATTGHAARGVSSVPSPAPTNLHMAAGSVTPEDLIADIKDGFYVTDLIGMGVNMVTGDYSRGASGFWIENGKRTYAVSEVTIAGHLLDMFAHLTPADDLEFRTGTNAPTLRLEGLTVAGQ